MRPISENDLTIESFSVRYGPVTAVNGVDVRGNTGRVTAIVGPNGAGKSSLLKGISGIVPERDGTVKFGPIDLSRLRPHEITRSGVAHVPEGRRVVGPLTVEENLRLAGEASRRLKRSEVPAQVQAAYRLFPILGERNYQAAGLLSGGQQQMLVIARALMSKPRWVLMDEPSMGLAPVVIDEVYALFKRLKDGEYGMAGEIPGVLLAEQSTVLAVDVADYVYVMNRGEILFEGLPQDLPQRGDLLQAYLG